jgi:hypothetical protein
VTGGTITQATASAKHIGAEFGIDTPVIAVGARSHVHLCIIRPALPGKTVESNATFVVREKEGQNPMKLSGFLLSIVLTFSWPFYWGYSQVSIWATIIWAVGMTVFAVITGWRDFGAGAFKSVMSGTIFALIGVVPV